jgi:hypothetical protein
MKEKIAELISFLQAHKEQGVTMPPEKCVEIINILSKVLLLCD